MTLAEREALKEALHTWRVAIYLRYGGQAADQARFNHGAALGAAL